MVKAFKGFISKNLMKNVSHYCIALFFVKNFRTLGQKIFESILSENSIFHCFTFHNISLLFPEELERLEHHKKHVLFF